MRYDYQKAKRYIENHKDEIDKAALGMDEDWFWTAETIFTDGEFTIDLDDEPEIAGIKSSYWATPTLEVHFKDGRTKKFNCYEGDRTGIKPIGLGGCITDAVSEMRAMDSRGDIDE